MPESILVYADWAGLQVPVLLGSIHTRRLRGTERMEFEYAATALTLKLTWLSSGGE